MKLGDLSMRVLPGDGIVGRFPGAVFAVVGPTARESVVVDAVVQACAAYANTSTAPDQDDLRLQLDSFSEPAAFCVVIERSSGLALFVHGELYVTAVQDGESRALSAGTSGMFHDLGSAVESLIVGEAQGGAAASPLFDLEEGVVPGRGFSLERAANPRAAEVRSAKTAPASGAAFRTIPLREPGGSTARSPLAIAGDARPAVSEQPQVDGILCARHHFNHPQAAYCAQCGISMSQLTHYIVRGPRPPLGILALDDGSAYTLDANYVIGRDPGTDPLVAAGTARPLALSAGSDLGDAHAEIGLDGWDVLVTDRGVPAGTLVRAPGTADWVRLPPTKATRIEPGAGVSLGGRTLIYHSVRKPEQIA